MSTALSFEVFGKPVTQGSKAWALWRVAVSEAALSSVRAAGWQRVEGPVVVEVAFTFDRPRKALRSGKYWQVTRSSGVVDHLVRVVIESFTAAGVWRDASNVVDVRATKLTVGDEGALHIPGARIRVVPVPVPAVGSCDPPSQADEDRARHHDEGQAVALDPAAGVPDGRPGAAVQGARDGVDEWFEQGVDGFGKPRDVGHERSSVRSPQDLSRKSASSGASREEVA